MSKSIKTNLGNFNTVEVLLFLFSWLLGYLSFLNEEENGSNNFSSRLESKKEEKTISDLEIELLHKKLPSLQALVAK
jgi:hypothetical protein